ncbi:MAG: hypothetical protein LBJ21_07450 [Acidobacteriota bacterium]|jgi:hypothetical protein|nr:hypothetical protein [Acidobacteriota bacterium]
MAEFKFEPQQASSPKKLIILALVVILLLGGIALYVRYNPSTPRPSPSAVNVSGVMRAGDTNFEYYKKKIRIEDVKASLGINYNAARIAMIGGMILNDGDRKLDAIELHVTLYDMWGNLSKERTIFVVRPDGKFNQKPMDPLERRSFNISLEGMEYYWDPKEISIEITGLKYK